MRRTEGESHPEKEEGSVKGEERIIVEPITFNQGFTRDQGFFSHGVIVFTTRLVSSQVAGEFCKVPDSLRES